MSRSESNQNPSIPQLFLQSIVTLIFKPTIRILLILLTLVATPAIRWNSQLLGFAQKLLAGLVKLK
jgi:hypothetical protein